MNRRKSRKAGILRYGMTLVEIMTASFLFAMLLVFIGSLYSDSITLYKRVDFQQVAQKSAGVILETLSREIRGAVRIEGPYNGVIDFPIDLSVFPLWQAPPPKRTDLATPSYVVFTNAASPINQENIFFHYNKKETAIFYYTKTNDTSPYDEGTVTFAHQPGDPTYPMIKKFSSDGRVVIENLEVWGAPDGVVLRVQLTDRSYTEDYNYNTDVAAAGSENKFYRRPVIEQSVLISIRYYN